MRLRVRVSAVSTGGKHGDKEEDEVECFSGGIVFIRANTEPGLYNVSRTPKHLNDETFDYRILLAGQGGTRGAGGVSIKVGGVVGLRQPMWDVDVGGEMWMVGVDWIVL